MNRSHPLKTFNKTLFYISFVVLLAAFWNRNDIPIGLQVSEALMQDPLQSVVTESPFSVRQNGIEYQVKPRFDYTITGMVMSYRHHDGNFGLHRLWNDHINVADVCVVWGDNLDGIDLNALNFWNGQFTCNIKTKDRATWDEFNQSQMSNNHLITDDSSIRKRIKDVRVGDQIQISGWLAEYRNDQGGKRGTSITRDDKGNGACETIFVDDFRIINSMDNSWRTALSASTFGLMASIIIFLVAVSRNVF